MCVYISVNTWHPQILSAIAANYLLISVCYRQLKLTKNVTVLTKYQLTATAGPRFSLVVHEWTIHQYTCLFILSKNRYKYSMILNNFITKWLFSCLLKFLPHNHSLKILPYHVFLRIFDSVFFFLFLVTAGVF